MTTTAPVPIVRGVKTIEEKKKFDYSKGVLPYIPEEVDDFETEATRYLNGEWREDQFIMYRLVRGVYGQRQPDVQMMRIKVPGGAMTADQMDAFGELVSKYAPLKKGHITTRENLQVHFVKLADTPHVMRILGDAGLITREACGNTVRNVAGDPLSGVKPEEPFFVAPYLTAYARYFVRHEYTQTLPRKWKTSFSSGGDDEVVADIHDLAFIPKMKDGVKGFEMRVGGGTSIMPRIAWVLSDFVPVTEYLKVAEAAIRVFHRTSELRKNKMRARIKFYVDRIGIEAFRAEVEKEMEGDWAKADFDPTPWMELPPEMIDEPLPARPCNRESLRTRLPQVEGHQRPRATAGRLLRRLRHPAPRRHLRASVPGAGRDCAEVRRRAHPHHHRAESPLPMGAGGPSPRILVRPQGDRPRGRRREQDYRRRLLPRHRQLQDGHHLVHGRRRGAA